MIACASCSHSRSAPSCCRSNCSHSRSKKGRTAEWEVSTKGCQNRARSIRVGDGDKVWEFDWEFGWELESASKRSSDPSTRKSSSSSRLDATCSAQKASQTWAICHSQLSCLSGGAAGQLLLSLGKRVGASAVGAEN
ncbi:MAG: hypothetical protein DCF15_09080 [Phormidesmis priestleyi]|uniref:Uncharacterized protein n=1 Tax=Phormidesmis priestleyi TaxID=268141 RepID=A0A2W4XGH5_9CYAN|nr:MAG: hypothetical protein DCF15_09080 [Phormidesmis priestleyi]